jgi:tetratricopeptide (TPR) repeat protein
VPLSRVLAISALSLGLLSATPVWADWHQVTTPRFIVYGEGGSRAVVQEAEELERLDRLMRQTLNITSERETPRLKVFLVRNRTELSKISTHVDRGVAGYYTSSPFGVHAALIRGEGNHVLFHEYAHHFMYQYFPSHYPGWFIEGFAEYFATANVEKATKVTMGYFSPGRMYALNQMRWIGMDVLLTAKPRDLNGTQRGAYYAQSWLLTHYIVNDPARLRAFGGYVEALRNGTPWEEALQTHFGLTHEQLRGELRRYLNGQMRYAELSMAREAVPTEVVTLPKAADDFVFTYAALQSHIPQERAEELLAETRTKAAGHPDNAMALFVLGNLEQVWGDNAKAEVALTRLLEVDPDHAEGLRVMAQLRIEQAEDSETPEARIALLNQAQRLLARAIESDPTDFRPYRQIAMIRSRAPNYPTDNDIDTLITALTLSPQVTGLRMQAVDALNRKGMTNEAEVLMRVLQNQPHAAGDGPATPTDEDEGESEDEGEDGTGDVQPTPLQAEPDQ